MDARTLRAIALALLALPAAAFATTPLGAAQTATPLPVPDLCGGIPGLPNPNAGCRLPLERGVNLAAWHQWWIPTPRFTSEDLRDIRAMGFTFVRVPVNPELLLKGTVGERTLDEPKADYVKRSFRNAIDAGLGVVIDMHPYDSYTREILLNETIRKEYADFLHAFAKKISDLPADRVALGLLNEPFEPDWDPDTTLDYNPIQKELWLAARTGDLDLTLIATGDDWSSIDGLMRVEPLPDPNVLYEFHFYTPFIFTHQGAWWSWFVVKYVHDLPYPATKAGVDAVRDSILAPIERWWERDAVADQLDYYAAERWNRARLDDLIGSAQYWAEDNNVRLFLGEFGVYDGPAPTADRERWTRDVREIAQARGIPWTYWDYNTDFGLVDGETGEVNEGLRRALLE